MNASDYKSRSAQNTDSSARIAPYQGSNEVAEAPSSYYGGEIPFEYLDDYPEGMGKYDVRSLYSDNNDSYEKEVREVRVENAADGARILADLRPFGWTVASRELTKYGNIDYRLVRKVRKTYFMEGRILHILQFLEDFYGNCKKDKENSISNINAAVERGDRRTARVEKQYRSVRHDCVFSIILFGLLATLFLFGYLFVDVKSFFVNEAPKISGWITIALGYVNINWTDFNIQAVVGGLSALFGLISLIFVIRWIVYYNKPILSYKRVLRTYIIDMREVNKDLKRCQDIARILLQQTDNTSEKARENAMYIAVAKTLKLIHRVRRQYLRRNDKKERTYLTGLNMDNLDVYETDLKHAIKAAKKHRR